MLEQQVQPMTGLQGKAKTYAHRRLSELCGINHDFASLVHSDGRIPVFQLSINRLETYNSSGSGMVTSILRTLNFPAYKVSLEVYVLSVYSLLVNL